MLGFFKADENTANRAAVDSQIRNGDFQLVAGLVIGIGRVKSNLCIQYNVVGGLIVLKSNLAGTEVIGNAVELLNIISANC